MRTYTRLKEAEEMHQEKKFDLWQNFQTKKSDIENIMDKLNDIVDTNDYTYEFNLILDELSSGASISVDSVDSSTLQRVVDKLDELKKKIDFELMPFYHMHLLQNDINSNLEEKENGIDEAINNCKELIGLLNKVAYKGTTDQETGKRKRAIEVKDLNKIYDNSIASLYKVIIYEQIYDKETLLNEIIDNPQNMFINEKLVKYLNEDLKSIRNKTVVKDELSNIDKGLSYDPLRASVIEEIIENKYKNERQEFYTNKAKAKQDLKKRIFDYQNEIDELKSNEKTLKASIKNIKVDRRINRAKLMSYVLVPVILIGSGFGIGVACSNKIDEYKTTTRVVNPANQKIVETISEVYDEKENTYTATVKVYSPWQKRGSTYIRNVYAYNYDPNKLDYESFDDKDSKYHYTEAKEQLDSNDSMEEGTVLITETIQDKSDSRKSTKYIIPFSIVGAVLSIVIDVLLGYNMGTYDIKVALRKLKKALDEKELVKEELLDDAKELYRDGSIIRNDCDEATNIYQFSDDEFSELKVIKKTWK